MKLIQQILILAIKLKPKQARKVLRCSPENSWMKNSWRLAFTAHLGKAHCGAAVKDAVSLSDMVVLETPEHTVLMTKETKSWMHFLRLLVCSLSCGVYGGRASLGWVCRECWQQDQLIEVEIRTCFGQRFMQPQSTLYPRECGTRQLQQTRLPFAHFESLALNKH